MERDDRDLGGLTCVFDSDGEDTSFRKYDGMKCEVIDRDDEDLTTGMGTMWWIRLENGIELRAFSFELKPIEEE